TNSTLTGNFISGNFGAGGGIYSYHFNSSFPGLTTLNNTIVGGNTRADGTTPSDLAGNTNVVATSSHNLIAPGGAGGLVTGATGHIAVAPVADLHLTAPGDCGGPTPPCPLPPGSPAIDAGDNALAVGPGGNPLTTDQRGMVARVTNGTVDIG